MPNGEKETLAIPARLRVAVDERDGQHCRVCGEYLGERRALHHIRYGGDTVGMGGRRHHAIDNLVTVGWLGARDCHSLVHGDKRLWVPILEVVVTRPGVTALQLLRWSRRRPAHHPHHSLNAR